MLKTTVVTSLALALALGSGIATQASAQSQPYSRTVKVSDLDLSSERDAQALLQRINAAARHVCSRDPGPRILGVYRVCLRDTAKRTVAQLNHPVVTAVFEGQRPIQVAGN